MIGDWPFVPASANRAPVKSHAPLTAEETQELAQLLEAGGGASLDFAHGVFAAVATAPTRKDVTEWLPLVLGDQLPDRATLEHVFGLLMRDFQAHEECLALSVPAVPAASDRDAITRYCKGYIRVTQADARWKSDLNAFALTLPLAMLSGYLSGESLATIAPELGADSDAFREKQREELADTVAKLYAYWADARRAPSVADSKVGRNDPCPCLSGKKFKKCCGAVHLPS